jgi:hypothetical protein
MVRRVLDFCAGNSFTDIRPDLVGGEKPEGYGGRIPDIEAYRSGIRFLIEIEDCDSISTSTTLEQLSVFSRGKANDLFRFVVVVPYSCQEDAEKVLRRNSITYDGLWLYYPAINDLHAPIP